VPVGPQDYRSGIIERTFDYWYGGHGHLDFYPKSRHSIFRSAKSDTQPEILQEGALSLLDSKSAFIEGTEAFFKARPERQPFCLSICFNLPHRAGTGSMRQRPSDRDLYRSAYRDRINKLALPAHYVAKAAPDVLHVQYRQNSYDYVDTEAQLREHMVRCLQTVTGIDNVLGAVHAQLTRLGLDRNTVIVFASDHGIMEGEFGLGGKALDYEPCLRIPLIVMDPRLPAARRGRRLNHQVQSIDVAPNLLDLAGLPRSASMQGASLAPLLAGAKTPWREFAFSENLWSTVFGNPRIESVKSAEWKYIRYFPTDRSLFGKPEGPAAYGVTDEQARAYEDWLTASLRGLKPGHEELFRIGSDPGETANLALDSRFAPTLLRLRSECDRLVRQAKGDLGARPETLRLPAGSSVAAD